jgi:mannose-6-phosphate isomerase-like protein (cupin superfamily)
MPAVVLPPGGGRAFMPQGKVKLEVGQSPDFAAFESELPAMSAGPPPHIHRIYDEAFYVLEGEVAYVLDGEQHTCSAGSFVFVPRGVAHGFGNPAEHRARMLVITTPDAIQGVEESALLMATPGPPDFQKLAEIFQRHQTEIVAQDQ